MQIKLESVSSALELKQAFVTEMLSIAQQIPETPTIKDIESVNDAIPHLKEVAESFITTIIQNPCTKASVVKIQLFYSLNFRCNFLIY